MKVYVDRNSLNLHGNSPEERELLQDIYRHYKTAGFGRLADNRFEHLAIELVPVDQAAELSSLKEPCVWTYNDVHGYWHTSCLEMFPMPEFVPSDNKMKFCCFCSHPIQEVTEDE